MKWVSRLIGALAAAGLLAGAPAEARNAHPALWKLTGKDTTIYLFGTFHLLPKGEDWHTPLFDRALASSQELVLEVPNIDDPAAVAQATMKMGLAAGLPPLLDRVPADRKAELEQMMKEAGVAPAQLDGFKTWMAALALVSVSFQRLGLDPASGVEMSITGPWRASGRPIRGLETIEEQFGFFDHLSEAGQRAFLLAVLESPADTRKEFAAMLNSWSNGDLAGIARSFDDETQVSPELRDVLMARRNAKWADWLKQRMDQPGTVFVAVGAGHLAGKDSVEAMLRARGLKAQRIQ